MTTVEDRSETPLRIRNDAENIRITCERYLGKEIPWLPLNSNKKVDISNYFHDKDRKLGWCLVPKVCSYVKQNVDSFRSNVINIFLIIIRHAIQLSTFH